ncbi:MAG: glycosyltransferase family 2 protein, partial [Candidatus Omnitrophica bacterium]|nr:glycosyltransferase family 2 protein [Candidatus Omnitrophota bacterium]
LEGWLDFMDRHPRVAASGCKLIFPDGNHQVGDAGFKPSLASVISYAVFLSKIFPRAFKSIFLNYDKYSKPLKVDWISGAALMLRKSVLKDTGLLNEDIFMFAEDVELGCRINSHGYDVFYLPYLTITHRQGSSVEKQKDKEDFSFLWFKNLRRLYFYYNKKEPVIIYDMIMICAFLLRSILYYLIYITTGNAAKKTKFDKLSGYLNFAIRNLGKPVNGYGNS